MTRRPGQEESDYTELTKAAYEDGVAKYEDATREILAEPEIERFIGYLPEAQGVVLDVGCAYGRDAKLLSASGVNVVGVDSSTAFIRRARELCPEVLFVAKDIREVEYRPGVIAGIWTHATLLHFKAAELRSILEKFAEWLMPGGVLFASFKAGIGEELLVEPFTNDSARFYKYYDEAGVREVFRGFPDLAIRDLYVVNEGMRWPGKRDIDWFYCFAMKER